MSEEPRLTTPSSMLNIATQSSFDGGMKLFEAACFMGNGPAIELQRNEMHARLDALLDAKATNIKEMIELYGPKKK